MVPFHNKQGNPVAVLDIYCKEINSFDETDAFYLEKTMKLIRVD